MPSLSFLSERGRAALTTAEWFGGLPRTTKAELLRRAIPRCLANGERAFTRGDCSDGFYIILEGILRLSGTSKNGRETVLDFYPPGSLIGEVSALAGTLRLHDADAHGRTLLLRIPLADMEQLVLGHPAFARALLRLEAQRLHLLLVSLEQYSVQTLEQRLANRLLLLTKGFGVAGETGVTLDLKLSQEMLARLTGATRQRINQILKEWEVACICQHRHGRITLHDMARLQELATL